jgi:hypothetical protein
MENVFYGIIFTLLLIISAYAQTTVDLTPIKDNTLYQDTTGSLSNGAGDYFFAGNSGDSLARRGLSAFDIAANIPEGATITGVVLKLHMSRTISGNTPVSLHRVSADWGEGSSNAPGQEGGGAPAATGDATWLHTFYDTDFWTNAGGDFSAMPGASRTVGNVGFYTWGSTLDMVADVQSWLDNPASNFGWLVMGDESSSATAKRFDTRENPAAANRPVLTITYNPSTGIEDDDSGIPLKFELAQNYPNPFNPTTQIRFTLNRTGLALLTVYNASGQIVAILVNKRLSGGAHTVTFNGEHLSSGVYFYRLQVEEISAVKKMLLIR